MINVREDYVFYMPDSGAEIGGGYDSGEKQSNGIHTDITCFVPLPKDEEP